MRVEESVALLCATYLNSKGSKHKFKVSEFMPHMEEVADSLEDAMETWH